MNLRSASPGAFALQLAIHIALRLTQLPRQPFQRFLLIDPISSLQLRNTLADFQHRSLFDVPMAYMIPYLASANFK